MGGSRSYGADFAICAAYVYATRSQQKNEQIKKNSYA